VHHSQTAFCDWVFRNTNINFLQNHLAAALFEQMVLVYFIYGLSFVLMSVAISVTRSTSSAYTLAQHVLLLGTFGFLHGFLEWTYVWRVLYGDPLWLTWSRPWLMLASFVFLMEFGRRLLLDSAQSLGPAWHRLLTPKVLYTSVALCIVLAYQLTGRRPEDLDILIRYFTCIPACLLSAVAIREYFRVHVHGSGVQFMGAEFARYSTALSAALIAYGVLAGVVVPASNWFPSSAVNQAEFQAGFGIPVQILRTLCALTIAWSAVCLLRLFRRETELTLRAALHAAKSGERALIAERELLLKNQALVGETHMATARTLAKSEFLANMSHEIRTPLSAISGMAMLIGREPLSTSQADKLRKLEVAARHLSATVNDILDLSKIESHRLVLEQRPVHLDGLLDSVAGMVHDKMQEKGLRLDVTVQAMPKRLLGDSTRLSQALLNYLGNAVKFTPSGSIGLHASLIEESSDSALVRLAVQDTGPGMGPEVISKLFEPFVQADNTITRQYGGSGLGLTITKKLAQAMGGEVGVDSEVGIGSTFWFTARLTKDTAPEATTPEAPVLDAATALATQYAGRRVLLAEDDAFNREIGTVLLEDVGLLVDVAEDGIAAVAMASSQAYDLILMDMQMPRLDGLEATRQIRASRNGKSVPIVALTANAFHEDKVRCLQAGMDDFLTKPVDPSTLYQVALRLMQSNSS
jgi:signal transduction histidine kinase/ActR/RegA family two-component response regulator